jgi:hypothetical protein
MNPASVSAFRANIVEVEMRVPDVLGNVFNVYAMTDSGVATHLFGAATIFPPAINACTALVSFVSVDDNEVFADARLHEAYIMRAIVDLAPHSRDSRRRDVYERGSLWEIKIKTSVSERLIYTDHVDRFCSCSLFQRPTCLVMTHPDSVIFSVQLNI